MARTDTCEDRDKIYKLIPQDHRLHARQWLHALQHLKDGEIINAVVGPCAYANVLQGIKMEKINRSRSACLSLTRNHIVSTARSQNILKWSGLKGKPPVLRYHHNKPIPIIRSERNRKKTWGKNPLDAWWSASRNQAHGWHCLCCCVWILIPSTRPWVAELLIQLHPVAIVLVPCCSMLFMWACLKMEQSWHQSGHQATCTKGTASR